MGAKIVAFLLLFVLVENHCQKIVIKTERQQKRYNFFPLKDGYVEFDVQTVSDIHVALTEDCSVDDNFYEIVYGGWMNTKSVIRKDQPTNEVFIRKGSIIVPNLFEKYWVHINETGNAITTGKFPDKTPLMTYVDPDPIKVRYFGISTGFGAEGDWHIDANFIQMDKCLNVHDNLTA